MKKLNITVKDIKEICDEVIFERGYDYFLENKVKNLTQNNGIILARVLGTDEYEVEIVIPENFKSIKDFQISCSCPFGDICKHIIAVLLMIAKNKKIPQENLDFDLLDKKDLIEIIQNIAKKHPEITNEFKELSNKEIFNEKSIDKELRLLFSGFIDYKSMNQLIKELNKIKRKILFLMTNNKNQEALVISKKIVKKIINPRISIDDSSGKLGDFLYGVLEISKQLIKNNEERNAFLSEFFPIYIDDQIGYGDYLEDIFIELYEKDLKFLEEYTLTKLGEVLKSQTKNKGHTLYHLSTLLLGVYEESKEHQKYIDFCKRDIYEYSDMHLVEKLEELKRYREAFEVCSELIKKGKASPFIESKFKELRTLIEKRE